MPKLTQMFDILAQSRALLLGCDVKEPPVDLGKLARRQQIREIRIDDSVVNGELRRLKNGGYLVRLDARDSEPRRRFTLAHEIAHTLLATNGDRTALDCSDKNVEDLCNLAAAELLVPDTILRRSSVQLDIRSVLALARKFSCSLEAAAWKLLNLPGFRGALLLWKIEKSERKVQARIFALARTLGIELPFARGMIITDSDPNWSAIALDNSDEIELSIHSPQISYLADRQLLGRNSVAVLIKFSNSKSDPASRTRHAKGQSVLF